MGFSRQEYWSGLPVPSPVDPILSELSTMTHWSWVVPTAWLSFTELDKAVVLWSDWLVFCDYGSSVSALWCPLTTPTILLGFLLPWTWGISSRLLQQSAAAASYLGRGVSSHGHPSWSWTWSSSSWPSCAHAAVAPWRWGCSSRPPPRPQTWGSSSALLLRCGGLALSAATPDLGRGVAALLPRTVVNFTQKMVRNSNQLMEWRIWCQQHIFSIENKVEIEENLLNIASPTL